MKTIEKCVPAHGSGQHRLGFDDPPATIEDTSECVVRRLEFDFLLKNELPAVDQRGQMKNRGGERRGDHHKLVHHHTRVR